MRKKLTALILGGIIAGSLLVPLAGCIGNPGKEDETVIPEWENNATLTENGVEIKWKEVENATEYRIYHSQSRFGDSAAFGVGGHLLLSCTGMLVF